ncbi:hypothetical protein NDU88_002859 [Pleurodeles waltl]|uniref:Uncharacterized protein n=1 Tax=Pleurodeles waltl TaxID=8319 RepID=A0AAV7KWL5_PLEWA|nr:hypothetical protein NDU88_002859 [Pleurodeles waltl]
MQLLSRLPPPIRPELRAPPQLAGVRPISRPPGKRPRSNRKSRASGRNPPPPLSRTLPIRAIRPQAPDRTRGAAPSATVPERPGRPNTGTPTAAAVQKGPEPPLLSPRPGQQQLPCSGKWRSRFSGTPGGRTTQGAEFSPIPTG